MYLGKEIEKVALAASMLIAVSGVALLGAWAQTRNDGEKQSELHSTIAFVSSRHDPAAAQPPDNLGGLDSGFSKAHNSRAVVRRPVSQQLVAFGLRPLRDAVAQIDGNSDHGRPFVAAANLAARCSRRWRSQWLTTRSDASAGVRWSTSTTAWASRSYEERRSG